MEKNVKKNVSKVPEKERPQLESLIRSVIAWHYFSGACIR